MLEKQLSILLARKLSCYIRDLNEEQIRVSLWSGNLVLRDVYLKSDILEQIALLILQFQKQQDQQDIETHDSDSPHDSSFEIGDSDNMEYAAAAQTLLLPFTVVKGLIRELILRVPWSNLDQEPVSVEVKGVELVFASLRSRPFNHEEEDARQDVILQDHLSAFEKKRGFTNIPGTAGCGEDPESERVPQKNTAVGGEPSMYVNSKPIRSRGATSSIFNLHRGSTAMTYVERLVKPLFANAHLAIRCVSIQYLFDYPGLHPKLATALSIFVDEVYVTPTEESLDKHLAEDFSTPQSRTVTVNDLFIAVHGTRTSHPKLPTASQEVGGAAVRESCSQKPASSERSEAEKGKGGKSTIGSYSIQKCFQCFCEEWEHTEVLVELSDAKLNIKVNSNDSGKSPNSQKNTQEEYSKSPRVALTYDSSFRPRTVLEVLFGSLVRSQASLGALLALKTLVCSFKHGLVGAPHRKFLYLLDGNTDSNCSSSRAQRRWAFALTCVRNVMQKQKQRLSSSGNEARSLLESIMDFCKVRRSYCGLFKRLHRVPWLPPLDSQERYEIIRLERKLTIEQALFLRCLSRAELGMEAELNKLQKQWIASAAAFQTKTPILSGHSVMEGDVRAETTTRKGLWSWIRWGRSGEGQSTTSEFSPTDTTRPLAPKKETEVATSMNTPNPSSNDPKARLLQVFHAEWSLAKRYLAHLGASVLKEQYRTLYFSDLFSPHSTSIAKEGANVNFAAQSSTLGLLLFVRCNSLEVSFTPRYWISNPTDTPITGFFERLDQKLHIRMNNIEWFLNTAQKPQDDRSGLSVFVKSFASCFSGTFNTPLLHSYERDFPQSEGDEDFLVVKRNATCTRMTVMVSPFLVIVRPTHELLWWSKEISQFWCVLSEPYMGTSFSTSSSSLETGLSRDYTADFCAEESPTGSFTSCKLYPLLSVSLASFDVLLPLFLNDFTLPGCDSKDDISHNPYLHLSQLESNLASTIPESNRFTQPPHTATQVEPEVGSYSETNRKLVSGLVGVVLRNQGGRNEFLTPSLGYAADQSQFFDEPYLVLSVPCAILKAVRGTQKHYKGPEDEIMITIGEELRGLWFYCQPGSMRHRHLPLKSTLEILSVASICALVNPSEVSIGFYNGVEVSIEPYVIALLNDRLLRPCVLYDAQHQSKTQSIIDAFDREWNESSSVEGVFWYFASPERLCLRRDGTTAITIPHHHGREYATLLYQWMTEHHDTLLCRTAGKSMRSRVSETFRGNTRPALCRRRRTYSFCLELARVFLRSLSHEDVVVMELMRPAEISAPLPEYRRYFENFSEEPHALEIMVSPTDRSCFGSLADVSITSGVNKSLSTVQSLYVHIPPEGRAFMHVDHLSVYLREELLECVELILAAAKTFDQSTLLYPQQASQSLEKAAASDFIISSSLLNMSWGVEIDTLFVELPYNKLIDYPYQALSVICRNYQINCSVANQVAHMELSGLITKALRIEEDIAFEEVVEPFVVLGPSIGLSAPPEELRYLVSLRWPLPHAHAGDIEGPEFYFRVSGGSVTVYMPFVMQSVDLASNPFFSRFLNLRQSFLVRCGLSLSPDGWPTFTDVVYNATNDSVEPKNLSCSSFMWRSIQIHGIVSEIDVLLASNSNLPIDISDECTYFFLHLGELSFYSTGLCPRKEACTPVTPSISGTMNKLPGSISIDIKEIWYSPFSRQPLSPLSMEVCLVLTFRALLELKEDRTGYKYTASNKDTDFTLLIDVRPVDVMGRRKGMSSENHPHLSNRAAGIDVVMSTCRMKTLLNVIKFNLMMPSISNANGGSTCGMGSARLSNSLPSTPVLSFLQLENPQHDTPHTSRYSRRVSSSSATPLSGFAIMLTMSSLRFGVATPDGQLISLKVLGGIQKYCARGGKWSQNVVVNLQIRDLIIDAVAYEVVSLETRNSRHTPCLPEESKKGRGGSGDTIAGTGLPPASLVTRPLLEVRLMGATAVSAENILPCCQEKSFLFRIEGLVEGTTVYTELDLWLILMNQFSDFMARQSPQRNVPGDLAVSSKYRPQHISESVSFSDFEAAARNFFIHSNHRSQFSSSTAINNSALGTVAVHSEFRVDLKNSKVVLKEPWKETLALFVLPKCCIYWAQLCGSSVRMDAVAIESPSLLVNTNLPNQWQCGNAHSASLAPVLLWGTSSSPSAEIPLVMAEPFISINAVLNLGKRAHQCLDETSHGPPTPKIKHRIYINTHDLDVYCDLVLFFLLERFVSGKLIPAFQECFQTFTTRQHETGHVNSFVTTPEKGACDASSFPPVLGTFSCEIDFRRAKLHFTLDSDSVERASSGQWGLHINNLSVVTAVDISKTDFTVESCLLGSTIAKEKYLFYHVVKVNTNTVELHCGAFYPITLPAFSIEAHVPMSYCILLDKLDEATELSASEGRDTRSVRDSSLRWLPLSSVAERESHITDIFVKATAVSPVFVSPNHIHDGLQIISTLVKMRTHATNIYCGAAEGSSYPNFTQTDHGKTLLSFAQTSQSESDACHACTPIRVKVEIVDLMLDITNVGTLSRCNPSLSGNQMFVDASSLESLAKLHLINPLVLCFDQNPCRKTVCVQVLLMGNFIVANGSGTRILFQHPQLETFPVPEKEPYTTHETSSPRTIEFTSSIDCDTQCVTSELVISGVSLNLSPVTYEFVLCMSQLASYLLHDSDSVGNTIGTGILNHAYLQSPSSCLVDPPCYRPTAQMSLSIMVHSISLCIENVAVLLLRSIHTDLSTLRLICSCLTGSAKNNMQNQTLLEDSCDILVGEMLLIEEGEPKLDFLHIKSTEIRVGADRINLKNGYLLLNGYSVSFIMELMEHIISLTTYAAQKIAASHSSSQSQFGLDLCLSLGDSHLRFYSLNNPLPSEGYVEAYFPNIIFTFVNDVLKRHSGFEVEHAVLSWVLHPSQSHPSLTFTTPKNLTTEPLILVTPVKASLHLEEDKVKLYRIVDLCVGDIECVLPVGNTLQRCMEAVAQFVLPFVLSLSCARSSETSEVCRTTLFSLKNELDVPNSEQPDTYTSCGSTDNVNDGSWALSKRHGDQPIVLKSEKYTLHIGTIDIHIKSASNENGLKNSTPRMPSVENLHTLLKVCFHKIVWEHSINPTHGNVLQLQVEEISSTTHPALQDGFVMAQATKQESSSYVDSTAALYIRKQTTLSSTTQPQTSSILCYAQDFRLVVSINLLSFLNNEVLAHIAMGMSRILNASDEFKARRHRTHKTSSALHDSSEDRVIVVYTDMCLYRDLSIGGRHGKQLHFVKGSFLGRSPQNTIRVTSANQARLLIFPCDLSQGGKDAPILIDEGLTVVVEGTPVILYDVADFKGGASAVQDYAILGPRSLLIIPEELVLTSCANNSQKMTQPSHSQIPRGDAIGTRFDLNALFNVRLQLWSPYQNISLDARISAQYGVEKRVRPGEACGSATIVDECGEVILHRLTMAYEGRHVTIDPIHFTLNVEHHRSLEGSSTPDFTAIHGILSPVKILLTMDYLRLITATVSLLLEGHTHIKDAMGLGAENPTTRAKTSPAGRQRKDINEREVNHKAAIQVGLTIPSVELVLLNSFFKPLFVCSIHALACQASGCRDMSSLSCRFTGVLTLRDYPVMGLPRRLLVRLSPEIPMDYLDCASDGVSLTGHLSLPETFLTVPMVTLLRFVAMQRRLQDQCTDPNAFFFRNELGVPLKLMPAEASGLAFPSPAATIPTHNITVGSCVKINYLDYNQTSFRVVVADGEGYNLRDSATGLEGTSVDISTLEQGSTHRFPLHELSIGTMDAVVRFDEATRLIRITTSVTIRNNMTSRTVALPGNGQEASLLLLPMQCSPVELGILRQCFRMQVDDYALHNLHSASFLPFQSIISAFLLLSNICKGRGMSTEHMRSKRSRADTDKCSQRTQDRLYWDRVAFINSDTLILPVALYRNLSQERQHARPQHSRDSSQIVVNLVFQKKLAREARSRTSKLLSKSEVEIVVEPVVSVLNYTGSLLRVELFVLPPGSERDTKSLDPTASLISVVRSDLLSHGERFEWYPSSPQMLMHTPFAKVELYTAGGDPQCIMRSIDYFSLSFGAECFSGMQSAKDPAISRGALVVQRLSMVLIAVKGLISLVNRLPVPVRPFDDSLNSLIFGEGSQDQALRCALLPDQQCSLLFPCDSDGKPPTSWEFVKPLRARIAVGSLDAKPSQSFLCSSIDMPVFLSSEDADCEWIFLALNESTNAEVAMLGSPEKALPFLPLTILKPAWTLHNIHGSLALRLRCVGLHCDEDVLVQPLQAVDLYRFGLGSHGNPQVQFRFETLSEPNANHGQAVDAGFSFEWSDPFRLASLSENALSVTLKHRLCAPDGDRADKKIKKDATYTNAKVQVNAERLFRHHGVCLFTSICTPKYYKEELKEEAFTCFTLTSVSQGQQCALYASLSNKPPLVIENRTSYTVQFDQSSCSKRCANNRDIFAPSSSSQSALGYIILPYTDVATCWEVASLFPSALHLVINTQHVKGQDFECTIDLEKAVAAGETIKVGNVAFVLVTQDYQSRCFFVSITENRMLENQLLFKPRFIAHLHVFVRNLTIFLASTCIPEKNAHLSDATFVFLRKEWEGNVNPFITTELTDAETISILKMTEFNVLQVCITSLLAEVSWNERHALTEMHINELSCMDCTSPSPKFPNVLHLGLGKGRGSQTKIPLETQSPCFSLRLHLLRAGGPFSQAGSPLKLGQASIRGNSTNPNRTENAVGPETQEPGAILGERQNSEIQVNQATVIIEELRLTCPTIHVCLHDNFLCVVRLATESVMEVYRLSQPSFFLGGKPVHFAPSTLLPHHFTQYQCSLQRENALKGTHPVKKVAVVDNFYVAKMFVHTTSLHVSLKRGTNSCFNPYEGLVYFPVPSIEKAILTIGGFCCQNISQRNCTPWSALFTILWPSYRLQFLLQFYKVIGAMEVLGNPIAVMNAWGRGVRLLLKGGGVKHDFLYGTEVFLRETISSTLHSIGLLSQVGGRTLATLSVDRHSEVESHNRRNSTNVAALPIEVDVSSGAMHSIPSEIEGAPQKIPSEACVSGTTDLLVRMAPGKAGMGNRHTNEFLYGIGGRAGLHACQHTSGSPCSTPKVPPTSSTASAQQQPLFPMQSLSPAEDCSLDEMPTCSDSLEIFQLLLSRCEGRSWFSTDSIRTREFISLAFYDEIVKKVTSRSNEKLSAYELCRAIINEVGAHNYALHASYHEFRHYATPEEFYQWVHVALDACLAHELDRLLNDMHSQRVWTDFDTEIIGSSMESKTEGLDTEKVQNIKDSVGVSNLLKYVTVDEFVKVCTLDEIKANVSLYDFQDKFSMPLIKHRCTIFKLFLKLSRQ